MSQAQTKTAVATQTVSGIPALAMDENELIAVLTTSLYPGAEIASVKMVIAYCRAAHLDPMQKPVHIVPMWDSKLNRTRDVIMPGVGLYRTQAARTGQYAGISDPEFGPEITETLDGSSITYPKFCKVTVKRMLANGATVEFSATEFWKENYATAGRKTSAPNQMWGRRPFGQIAKCVEAQALRKAFPEVGSAPTADEMEGKDFEQFAKEIDPDTGEIKNPDIPMPKSKPTAETKPAAESKPAANVYEGEARVVDEKPKDQAKPTRTTKPAEQPAAQPANEEANSKPAEAGMLIFLRKKAEAKQLTDDAICAAHGIASIDGISEQKAKSIIDWIRQQ